MEELIVFRVAQQLNEPDYTEFSKQLKAVKAVRITYIILSAVMIVCSLILLALKEFTGVVFLLIAVSSIILIFKYPNIMGANLFKNYSKLHHSNPIPSEVVLCENHIYDNTVNSSTTFEYNQFEKIVETDTYFFLMITNSAGLILRKDSFTQGDITQFRGFIASKSHIY